MGRVCLHYRDPQGGGRVGGMVPALAPTSPGHWWGCSVTHPVTGRGTDAHPAPYTSPGSLFLHFLDNLPLPQLSTEPLLGGWGLGKVLPPLPGSLLCCLEEGAWLGGRAGPHNLHSEGGSLQTGPSTHCHPPGPAPRLLSGDKGAEGVTPGHPGLCLFLPRDFLCLEGAGTGRRHCRDTWSPPAACLVPGGGGDGDTEPGPLGPLLCLGHTHTHTPYISDTSTHTHALTHAKISLFILSKVIWGWDTL